MNKIQERLQKFIARYNDIEAKISNPSISHETIIELSKERSDIEDIVEMAKEREDALKQIAESNEIIIQNEDAQLVEMAELEINSLKRKLEEIDEKLKILLTPKSKEDKKSFWNKLKIWQ
jgi:peptide chain release factor 1